MKGVILLIFDGMGVSAPGPGNAYFLSDAKNFNTLINSYPHTLLKASGEAVGLPANEVGSTEVGHLNIGAGKIVYQSLPRINLSIADGTFFSNEQFLKAINHVKQNNSTLHLLGLIGAGSVHASTAHLFALLHMCKENKVEKVALHLITDGRDSPPKAAMTYLEDVQEKLESLKLGRIASVMGRYYAMDRDKRWERIEKAYKILTDTDAPSVERWHDAIQNSYQEGKSDEFIDPIRIVPAGQEQLYVKENDAVIFYNFRIDRPRQLTKAFTLENFEVDANKKQSYDPYTIKYFSKHTVETDDQGSPPFQRGPKIKNLEFVTMTEYEEGLPVDIAYPPHIVNNPLGGIISQQGLSQLRMSESEKERFVTYYFNGLRTGAFPMEDRIIVPSPRVATYDLQPEMSSFELTDVLVQKIREQTYQFILVNYANPDMVGHTGNLQAGIQAMKAVDTCVQKVVEAALTNDYGVVITADHGNIEEMINRNTGAVSTEHTDNPVPLIIISKELRGKNTQLQSGILADVAPTILSLLNIPKPHDMTGRNLLSELNLESKEQVPV